jgi:hypothetical protein
VIAAFGARIINEKVRFKIAAPKKSYCRQFEQVYSAEQYLQAGYF